MAGKGISLQSTIKLNDGVEIPVFGLGVFRLRQGPNEECETIASEALKFGYRLIDTAQFYKLEVEVGNSVRNSGVPRNQVFVVSKLWNDKHTYDRAKLAVEKSLSRMKFDYIDLYLIHSPMGDKLVDTYRSLLDLKKAGKIRSVGVSNFGIAHLEGLKKAGLPAPSVNQIEYHCWQHKAELVEYCKNEGITIMGYSPLAKGSKIYTEPIPSLAAKYKRTNGQIMIRYSVQSGYITIPKTSKIERIEENANVFDFELSEEDMKTLDSLPEESCAWDPTTMPFVD